jgi:hypothetical protein
MGPLKSCGNPSSSSANFEDASTTLIALTRPTSTLRPATQLFVTDHRQYWPQPLVVGDGTLIGMADLIEGAVSEFDALVADRQPAIGIIENGDALADRRLGLLARLQDKDITLSYWSVSACERVRSSFQATAPSKSSPARNGRCRSFLFAGGLAKRVLSSAMNAGRRVFPSPECARRPIAAP